VISNLEFGGAQRQVIELANQMLADGNVVDVCSLSSYVPLASSLRNSEQRLHVINKRFMFDASVVPKLAALLRRGGYDVVHSFLFDAEIAVRLAGRLAGTPLIVGSERNTDYRLKKRQLLAYRLSRGCVDLVIANSSAGAAFNSRTLEQDPGTYRVVYNGVDTTTFAPADGRAGRRELGLDEHAPVVGMFASFKAQKNHPLLFAAARHVLDRIPSTRFLLVGDELYAGMHGSDEYKRTVNQLVDALGIRSSCLFLGNRADVARLYPVCDVTVLPSLFEGTPNVALESMASGVPVVATDVSDNAKVIPDGRVGYIVRLGDAKALAERLCQVLEDPSRRMAMGRAAREWAMNEFSTARLAAKTEAVYREGLGRRRIKTAGAA
jgi:glycosyltransferase involved in cell wall biosynthesis